MPPKPASIRIIGGESGGRKIPVPQHRQLRPSGARVRESLFNRLGQRLDGLVCLDLFAGSGVLGLEAASRGAAHVVLVERQRKTAAAIRAAAAAAALSAEVVVLAMSAEKFLSQPRLSEPRLSESRRAFDLIFLDPPFADYSSADAWRRLLAAVAPHLADGGRIYRESGAPLEPPPPWEATADERTGRVFWQILQKAA